MYKCSEIKSFKFQAYCYFPNQKGILSGIKRDDRLYNLKYKSKLGYDSKCIY